MEIFVEEDKVILRKYEVDEACVLTGEITPDNFELSNGMYLSPRGAQMLMDEIKEKTSK